MAKRLLNRQASLIDYLTSSAAIFGDKHDTSLDKALRGIDRELLNLEAKFSYEKRMAKIVAVFPKTFQIWGPKQERVVRGFVETCPPVDISRLVNAQQFHDFLSAYWELNLPDPPYLRDVAACEFACARVRTEVGQGQSTPATAEKIIPGRRIRRSPGAVLLRCAYDIRPIFEEDAREPAPLKRDTPIAIAVPPGTGEPRVFELLPDVFEFLAALDDWADPVAFCETPEANQLVADLAERGLIEVGR